MVRQLRADRGHVIIYMSHGGVCEPEAGPITEGEDIDLARVVPEIDVIVGRSYPYLRAYANHRRGHARRAGRLLWSGAGGTSGPHGRA